MGVGKVYPCTAIDCSDPDSDCSQAWSKRLCDPDSDCSQARSERLHDPDSDCNQALSKGHMTLTQTAARHALSERSCQGLECHMGLELHMTF